MKIDRSVLSKVEDGRTNNWPVYIIMKGSFRLLLVFVVVIVLSIWDKIKIYTIFKDYGLNNNNVFETNLPKVSLLDITTDLRSNYLHPFWKPNDFMFPFEILTYLN